MITPERVPRSATIRPPGSPAAISNLTASDHGVSPRPRMRLRVGRPEASRARLKIAAAAKPSASLWLTTSKGRNNARTDAASGRSERPATLPCSLDERSCTRCLLSARSWATCAAVLTSRGDRSCGVRWVCRRYGGSVRRRRTRTLACDRPCRSNTRGILGGRVWRLRPAPQHEPGKGNAAGHHADDERDKRRPSTRAAAGVYISCHASHQRILILDRQESREGGKRVRAIQDLWGPPPRSTFLLSESSFGGEPVIAAFT
jgi:hypothetical protein